MTFEPTTRDLELIATMSQARAPSDKIAAVLGISEDAFAAWCQRLALGRSYVEPVSIPERPIRVPKSPRIVAERIFMDAKEAPAPLDEDIIQEASRRYSC
jgi:hypothetical protein